MGRFKRVLVAASPGHLEPAALRAAVRLADTSNAHLTVLSVLEPLPRWRRTVKVEGRAIDLQDLVLRDRSERLRRFVEFTRPRREVALETRIGKPLVEVVRFALSHDCDLVVVGETEPSKGSRLGVSTGVMQLLRQCPVPVWAIRPTRGRTLGVLALVDPDPTDPVRDGLNDLVLELATSMVRQDGGELHVAHAWNVDGEATAGTGIVQAVVDEHQAQLDGLTERHGVSQAGGFVHLVQGEAGGVLPELAERLNINLIVMGTMARTGLRGLLVGNTAETILRSVRCSVLALKPEGFVSPVGPEQHSEKAGR
jgi:nucleotide-binding universal stress UspA family protein